MQIRNELKKFRKLALKDIIDNLTDDILKRQVELGGDFKIFFTTKKAHYIINIDFDNLINSTYSISRIVVNDLDDDVTNRTQVIMFRHEMPFLLYSKLMSNIENHIKRLRKHHQEINKKAKETFNTDMIKSFNKIYK